MSKNSWYSLLLLLLLMAAPMQAQVKGAGPSVGGSDVSQQAELTDSQLFLEIEMKLQRFTDEMSSIRTGVSVNPMDSIDRYERKMAIQETKWNTYYQAMQMDIAASDDLMEKVAKYQELSQATKAVIEELKKKAQDQQDFEKTEIYIGQQKEVYAKMYKEAMKLSLVAKLAPQLEKLKGKEQLIFADIQAHYNKAKTIAEENTELAPRMQKLESQYIELKGRSDKIQAAVYQPLIQRIKDKLLIAAAMAIIMMFVAMINSKIQAIKNARDMAKKFKSQFQNDQEYPTI